ncbi:MAG: potassium transporter TrkG [Calditrichia bacterium]
MVTEALTDKFNQVLNVLMVFVALLALATLVAEYGFYLPARLLIYANIIDLIIVGYFLFHVSLKLIIATDRKQYFLNRRMEYALASLVIIAFLIFIIKNNFRFPVYEFIEGKLTEVTKLYLIGFQVYIILNLLLKASSLNQKVASYQFHPGQILMASFGFIILVGTGLLMLPRAVAAGESLSLIDALFTATSATCVTGLIVVDTGTHFSTLGQGIILALIQIGGLGLMTYASFFALVFRRQISLKEKSMLRDMLNYDSLGIISRLLTYTILLTLTIESIGAVLLYFSRHLSNLPFGERLFSAIFHSISAFCNAGFSLYSDSFMSAQQDWLLLLTVCILIILGGLGFPVLVNIFRLNVLAGQTGLKRWSLQTKLVLISSGILLALGTVAFLFFENGNTLSGMNTLEKLMHAFFQSVTTRTAGFNTVDIGMISVPTLLLFLMLMFIGASPGSTGGGIKTTTISVLLAAISSIIRGRNRVDLAKRNIPFIVVNRALVILLFSGVFIFVMLLILTVSENLPFLDILFETFSAFGTVGLSRGITPLLSDVGKVVIVITMFFGRLGALTISLALARPDQRAHFDYPSENIMVG